MELIDRVKYDAEDDSVFVWKYPSEDLVLGSQVIVNQSQEVIFVKGGEVLDTLGPGTHTLSTGNIPLLNKIINFPFGGKTPFTSEVWYVNNTVKRDLNWGTPSPIPVLDPGVGFPVSVRSFGKWGVRIVDSRSFVTQIVGTIKSAEAEKIHNYFIGEINQKLAAVIATAISGNQISILSINASLNEISNLVSESIKEEFTRFGIELINFNIESINIPKEELEKIQEVFAKKMEAEQLSQVQVGGAFTAIKSFETLKAAAENESSGGGTIGGMLGAGIGLGMGLPVGQQLGQNVVVDSNKPAESNKSSNDVTEKLKQLKSLLDEDLITQEQFDAKRQKLLEDL